VDFEIETSAIKVVRKVLAPMYPCNSFEKEESGRPPHHPLGPGISMERGKDSQWAREEQ